MAKTRIGTYHVEVTGAARTHFDRLRDVQHLARDTKIRRSSFLHTYQTLRAWASANGLLGPELGYLSSLMLLCAAHAVSEEVKPSSPRKTPSSDSASTIACTGQYTHNIAEQAGACIEQFKRLVASSRFERQDIRSNTFKGLTDYAMRDIAQTNVGLDAEASVCVFLIASSRVYISSIVPSRRQSLPKTFADRSE